MIGSCDQMTVKTSMTYRSRLQTIKRTLSMAKGGLFGVRIRAVTRSVCIACCARWTSLNDVSK